MGPVQRAISLIAICSVVGVCSARSKPRPSSLCDLREKVADGQHISVLVSAVYSVGPENSKLDDPACAVVPYGSTWVEFDLSTKRNDKKLGKLLEHSAQVYLTAEGDLYGRPLPDPDARLNAFQGRWGHLSCCGTKLVVHVIREVKTAPKVPNENGSHN